MKKWHKLFRKKIVLSIFSGPYTLCKVENKTYAFNASYKWGDVNCVNCLKYKRKRK